MKRLLLASMIVFCAPSAFADFIGVHGSISSWQSTFSGEIAGKAKLVEREGFGWGIPSFKERGFSKNNQLFGHIAFEHPIPLLPNIRLDVTKIADSGTSLEEVLTRSYAQVVDENLTLDWDISQNIHTELNIDAFDLSLYYEILDNWVNWDIGLSVRQMTGEFIESTYATPSPRQLVGGNCEVKGLIQGQSGYCIILPLSQTTDIDVILPLLYSEIRFDLPLSGFFVGGRGKAIAYDSNKVYDYELEGGYMFDMNVMEIGAALGYRKSRLEADDLEGLYSDASLSGFYGSLKIHF